MNNDRLKFRVWNIEHGFYCDQMTEMVINSDGFCYDNGVRGDYSEHDGFVIEQCTGLKDKNGNLIYEEDILQNPNKDQYIVEWIVDGYWHIRQIDDEKFGCALASIKTLYDGWEIIGNIHEQAKQKDIK